MWVSGSRTCDEENRWVLWGGTPMSEAALVFLITFPVRPDTMAAGTTPVLRVVRLHPCFALSSGSVGSTWKVGRCKPPFPSKPSSERPHPPHEGPVSNSNIAEAYGWVNPRTKLLLTTETVSEDPERFPGTASSCCCPWIRGSEKSAISLSLPGRCWAVTVLPEDRTNSQISWVTINHLFDRGEPIFTICETAVVLSSLSRTRSPCHRSLKDLKANSAACNSSTLICWSISSCDQRPWVTRPWHSAPQPWRLASDVITTSRCGSGLRNDFPFHAQRFLNQHLNSANTASGDSRLAT